jgi:hypothetical protein
VLCSFCLCIFVSFLDVRSCRAVIFYLPTTTLLLRRLLNYGVYHSTAGNTVSLIDGGSYTLSQWSSFGRQGRRVRSHLAAVAALRPTVGTVRDSHRGDDVGSSDSYATESRVTQAEGVQQSQQLSQQAQQSFQRSTSSEVICEDQQEQSQHQETTLFSGVLRATVPASLESRVTQATTPSSPTRPARRQRTIAFNSPSSRPPPSRPDARPVVCDVLDTDDEMD